VLEQQRRDAPHEPELGDVVLLMHVEDEQHARLAQPAPERREERDAVDDLEHDVGVAADAAQRRPRRLREDGHPRAHPVDLEPLVRPRDALGAGVGAGDHRDAMPGVDPARDLAVEDRAGAARLGMRPVAIHQDQDVTPGRHAGATVPSRVMPSPVRIAAVMAVLALLLPPAALAQSGGDGGAGDSQYQDPFGTQTQSRPSKPAAPAQTQQQQPAQQQTTPAPAQQQTTPAPAPTAQAAQAQGGSQAQPSRGQTGQGQTLPRTGFDVLPVAAIGLLLLLGGLALWRRPHGQR
jgi:hypothetical protein